MNLRIMMNLRVFMKSVFSKLRSIFIKYYFDPLDRSQRDLENFYKGMKMAFRAYKKDNVITDVRYCNICQYMTPHYSEKHDSFFLIKCVSCENISGAVKKRI
jgi:hypothetical protein